MEKFSTILLFLFSTLSFSQDFRYLSMGEGLSSRRVYSIQKDSNGYMWFLTQEGIDRFNGIDFNNYKLSIQNKEIPITFCIKRLMKDNKDQIWIVTKEGQLFKYNILLNKFQLYFNLQDSLPGKLPDISYAFIDKNNEIWLYRNNNLHIFNPQTNGLREIELKPSLSINHIEQIAPATFFISTSRGIYKADLFGNELKFTQPPGLKNFYIEGNSLFYHEISQQLLIGTPQKGIFVYNILNDQIIEINSSITETTVNTIQPFNEEKVLIATETAGVYKMDISTYKVEPYLNSVIDQPYQMNGNNIKDIYIDKEKRIWMANYPIGITIFDKRYPHYKWIQHSPGNKNSLANNQVNYILEDSEGDLWYATNNGVSLYHTQTDTWTTLFKDTQSEIPAKNLHFLSLCEISPGIILAGGHMHGLYRINKQNLTTEYLFHHNGIETDKCTHILFKDSQNKIWVGGEHHLKQVDIYQNKIETVNSNLPSANTIIEKDSLYLWIGTNEGVFLFNKNDKKMTSVELGFPIGQVNTLYQDNDGVLYIGTSSMGMIIYNSHMNNMTLLHIYNSNLISNTINCILPNEENILISTEHCIAHFNPRNRSFRNWTKDRGLMVSYFNPNSGVITQKGTCVLGSGEGAIEFDKTIQIPTEYKNKIIFNDFQLFYETVFPGDKNSPLTKDINETSELHLNHNQNLFSISLSSINYDYPSNILYSWKLEGFYNEWNRPTPENKIRFTNLNPGKYTLRVRAVSNEDWHVIEERSLNINIKSPFWATIWAKFLYLLLIVAITWLIMRHYYIRKESKISNEKIDFFINTAHDIRTPLTLIKAPLDEILDKENLSASGEARLMTAIRNTNNLYKLINNLINFEKSNIYSYQLCVEEFELYTYLEETLRQFKSLAENKKIDLFYESNFHFLTVWFDKAKMDSILKNLISNAIKYTPPGGCVKLIATSTVESWSIEITDTGIGIPHDEQNKLFNMFFRGSNAVNSQIPGSGIGLLLVKKQIQQLKGKITVKTIENQGSSFKIVFHHGKKAYRKKQLKENQEDIFLNNIKEEIITQLFPLKKSQETPSPITDAPIIMIVDDNDELREYLKDSLSEQYRIVTAVNGQEALQKIKTNCPNLVIADVMMPEMRGDVLCAHLKNDINTSHIPVILLSALSDREDIIEGLSTKADEYLTKPFDIAILKAIIANLLENRVILAKRYAKLDYQEVNQIETAEDLDMEFMRKVIENIELNMDKPEFNVDTLCANLHMSRSSFYNKIKALTNQAPADFIRMQKLNRAAQLLKTRKYTMTEIADKIGFSDAKYFREVFKKHFKKTPSQYINENEE